MKEHAELEDDGMTSGSEQDMVIENKISFIEEIVNVIYDLGRIIPDQSPRLTRVILKSLVVSLIKVKEEWEQADVGKLEKTIQRMKERDQELSAIIGHMADQLIGRVPIKPVETDQAKDALIIDLQQRHNDLNNRLKEATKHAGELVAERDDLQKVNAKLTKERDDLKARVGDERIKELCRENADLRFLHNENAEINHLRKTNTDLVGKLEELRAENNDLRMQVEHLEGEVEPNEQIEKLTAELNDLRTKDDTEALAHVQEANTDLTRKVEKLERLLARQDDRVNKLRRDKEILGEKLTRLKGDVGLSVDVPTMRKELDAKNRNIRHMHKTIDELRQVNADLIETRRSLIEDRDRRHEAAQSECLKKEHAIEQLEMAKKELVDRQVMIGDLKGKVEALDSMIATRDSRIQSLLEENAELSGQVSNLQSLVARPDLGVPFIKSIDKIAKERDEARASNKALSSVGESMFEENEALRKINKELEEERKEKSAKIKELEEECEKVTLDRTDLVKQVRKAERHNKDLKGKLVEARTAIKELEDGYPPADIQARMIDQLQERNEKLFEENASLRQINRELADGNERMESELKARDVEFAKRGKRIEDLRTTAEQQREEIRQLENKIAAVNEEAEQLEKEAEQLTSDANMLERQLVKAQEFKQQLVDGITYAFGGEVSPARIADTLALLTRQDPAVKEQVRLDLEFLRSRNAELADNLEQRKQDAVEMIKKAAPGAWKVVGARPLHGNEDGGDNEEASPEKEESEES